MTPFTIPRDDDWPQWTLVDRERLASAHDEQPFFEVAAALATEFGRLTELLAQAQAGQPASPDEAVLRGLCVRIAKLTRRLIAESYERRREMQDLLDRVLFESTVDLAYMLQSRGRARAFRLASLRADRRVWAHLDRNRERRGGEVLPQEQRMRARLERSFALAGVVRDELDALGEPSGDDGSTGEEGEASVAAARWPPFAERLAAIGEPDAHAMHQLGADVVHGTWHELVTHHLADADTGDGHYEPKLAWSAPRAQPLHALAIQGSRVMAAYASRLGPDLAAAFRDRYLDLAGRAAAGDRLHEQYLECAHLDHERP